MIFYGVTIHVKPLQHYIHMKPFVIKYFTEKKNMQKIFLVLFLSWSLLGNARVSLKVRHISKLEKNAIKWPCFFTPCCSLHTDFEN